MEDENIKVSIICNAYNHEKYIGKTLECIISQNVNFPIEILIHDDASTDKTPQIIKDFFYKNNKVIKPLFQSTNQYSKYSITTKFQFPRVKGKYIALCEGDDYWTDSTKLQKQYDFMEKYQQCSLVCHNAVKISENGKFLGDYSSLDNKYKVLLSTDDIISNLNLFPTASIFFRKSFVDSNIEFLQSNPYFDYVLKILLSTEGDICLLPYKMSAYRVCSNGSWSSIIRSNVQKYIEHLQNSIIIIENINKYKKYKFNESIQKEILRRKLIICLLSKDFHPIKEEPLKTLYTKLDLKTKIKYLVKYHFCPFFNR